LRLKVFQDAVLIFQIGFNCIRVLQNEGNGAVDLCQRSDGRIRFENRVSGPSASKVLNHNVETDPGAGNVVAAIANFDVFICWHHRDSAHLHFTHFEAAGLEVRPLNLNLPG
jgi:hypothetical protein